MNLKEHYNIFVKQIKQRQKDNNWNPCETRSGYERHHLKPRFKGGTWSSRNLILVTKREHIHIHWLLWKLHPKTIQYCAAYVRTKSGKQLQLCDKDSKEFKMFLKAVKNCHAHRRIAVVCLENKKVYKSITEASIKLGVQDTHIRSCIYEWSSWANGYHFVTKEWYDNASEIDILNRLNDTPKHRMIISHAQNYFICLEKSTIYKGIGIAQEFTDESKNNINRSSWYHNKTRTSLYEWRCISREVYESLYPTDDYEIFVKLSKRKLKSVLQLCY